MNAANSQYTRWLTLAGTIVTQFALGSVYTWSLFNSSLSAKLNEPVSQVAFSFGLLLNFRVGIVMSHHHRIALAQQTFNLFTVKVLFIAT